MLLNLEVHPCDDLVKMIVFRVIVLHVQNRLHSNNCGVLFICLKKSVSVFTPELQLHIPTEKSAAYLNTFLCTENSVA